MYDPLLVAVEEGSECDGGIGGGGGVVVWWSWCGVCGERVGRALVPSKKDFGTSLFSLASEFRLTYGCRRGG